MIQNLCLNPSIVTFCDIIHLEIFSFIYERFHRIRPSCFADYFKPLSSVHSLRSGRLEVVGTRKNRRVRTRPRVSPSRARSLFRSLLPSACYAGYSVPCFSTF